MIKPTSASYYARFPHARRLDNARGMARDENEEYPRAHKAIEGGINTLAEWCAENFSRKDIERLIAELDKVLNKRVEQTIAGDGKRRDGRAADPSIRATTDRIFAAYHAGNAEKEYLERFPHARRLSQ